MDPLSIATSAAALVSTTGKVVKLLHELYGTIEDAPLLLASIISECAIVHTSLGVLQDLHLRRSRQGGRLDQVSDAFEIAFTGCALILSVLEKDVQACLRANKSPQDRDAIKKLKLILSRDHLQELVMQLRGQQQALTLLINTLQSRTLEEINVNVDDNREILGGLARHARRLYVESDHFSISEQLSGEIDPSIEIDSIVTSTRFAFDNEIIASRAYQKTLAYVHRLELRQAEFVANQSKTPEAGDYTKILDHDSNSGHTERGPASPVTRPTERHEADREPVLPNPSPELQLQRLQIEDVGPEHSTEQTHQIHIDFGDGPDIAHNVVPRIIVDSHLDSSIPSTPPTKSSSTLSTETLDTADSSVLLIKGPVPAAQSRTGDLLLDQTFEKIWARAAVRGKYNSKVCRKTVWVGDASCGKTYALISGIKRCFPSVNVPTVFENYVTDAFLDLHHFELALWDTAGFGEYERLRPLSYPDSHVVIMCYNIANRDSLENCELNIDEVQHFCETVPIVFVGCQLDLRDDQKEIEWRRMPSVTYAEGLETAKKIGAVAYVECSAKTGEGLDLLFEAITKTCVLGDSIEWREKSRKRNSTISLSKMFRRKSQNDIGTSVADPKFSMTIDYSWKEAQSS